MLRIVHDAPGPDANDALDGPAPDLDELCRLAAREMLAIALEAERRAYLEAHADRLDAAGHRLVVGNGSVRARAITTGAGRIEVAAPRVDDRRPGERFRSALLPPYARRSPKVSEVLPILHLRGLSSGDFGPALATFFGSEAGLSASTISRLTESWQAEHVRWSGRDLSTVDYVYWSVDGVHFRIRLEEDRLCCLVIIGVRPDGTKELVAVADGYRESTESWAELLRDLEGSGSGGPRPRHRRRGARLLGRPARRLPGDARAGLLGAQDDARPRRPAEAAPRAGEGRPRRDLRRADPGRRPRRGGPLRRGLRRPSQGRRQGDLRPRCPARLQRLPGRAPHPPPDQQCESTFAGVRLRTNVAKRARVRENALYLVFKIVERLATRWRVLNGGATVMALVLAGERFVDGILVKQPPREEERAA